MEILENRKEWIASFRDGWLAHYQQTGEFDWDQYPLLKNKTAPAGKAIDLSASRLMLISSAGGYLPEKDSPFDAAHTLGDYTIRTFPTSTPFDRLAYAHTHYDQAAVDQDPQVLLPLRHLEDMVTEGVIGELSPSVISFTGYHPDVGQVIDETIPAIVQAAEAEEVHAALLVPA